MREVMVCRAGTPWRDQARAAIHELSDGHRLIIRPAAAPIHPAGCFRPGPLDLVTVRFDFARRSEIVVARLQRVAMVGLLLALRDVPTGIVVGYGGTGMLATYRSCALSDELYAKWKAGTGARAVPGGQSYHNRGLSADAPVTPAGREAMIHRGFEYIGAVDPSHATYGHRG